MDSAARNRVVAVVLAVATLAICVFGVLNYIREGRFEVPTDGAWWLEAGGGLQAERVPTDSPAFRAGVRPGDLLLSAREEPTGSVAQLSRQQMQSGTWSHIDYQLRRGATALSASVILEPKDHTKNQSLRLIAMVYLSIGLYVLFRRWTAPKATHFFVFCLVSAVLYAFKYTGQLDTLDWIFYWGNIIAAALQPALFLHFATSFGVARSSAWQRVLTVLLYLPGAFLVAVQVEAITQWQATERLNHRLDQIGVGYLALYYVIAAVLFWVRYRRTSQPLERQQLKWLTRGTLLSILPFTALYVIPYLSDAELPTVFTRIAGFALIFLPLTFAWAIVRYRLMDTDLIFKRGVTYTLATAALVGVYFAVVGVSAEVVHTRLPNLRIWGLLAAIVATALIFDPIKTAIQARVDRIFDRKRYDYRETLIEFSRSLSSQTDLSTLGQSIVERLSQSLLVSRVAVFLAVPGAQRRFSMLAAHGLPESLLTGSTSEGLPQSFLNFDDRDYGHLFFENTSTLPHLSAPEQRMAASLDMNYYLPCRVADRETGSVKTIAVIGLGRTQDGDFLSSEDMELLESLAGYIGIAIQNAQLFAQLERQIGEFERLKEFNENIVESIKVGIFALDLDDRVESWNAEMEVMYALPRSEALGRHVSEIFPPAFTAQFDEAHRQSGTHHLSRMTLELRSGETRTTNLAIAPLLTRDFVLVGSIVLMEDITERTQLEQQLTQAEKLSSIGLLAAGVAHEVNTPLAVISSYTQMLQKHASDDQRLLPVLEKITQQTFRASEIVNGLLNFSRTTATEFSDLDLNGVLRETLTLLDHQLRTARIRVETDFLLPLPKVHGSQGKLQQVVLNLLLNAKDAMVNKGGGVLTVATSTMDGEVILEVRDTGSGIEREHLHRIYDPFFTTKNAPKQGQHKGTGLGLSVSYGIMQEHKGRIHAESEPGVGTSFFLVFPVSASTGVAAPAAETVSAAAARAVHA